MSQTSIATWLKLPEIRKDASSSNIELTVQKKPSFARQAFTQYHLALPKAPSQANDKYNLTEQSFPRDHDILLPQCSKVNKSLPPNVSLEFCSERYINLLKRLNALLLPIPYQERFYKETIEDRIVASLTRVALWHESSDIKYQNSPEVSAQESRMVAAIRCRLLNPSPTEVDGHSNPGERYGPVLYISTIGTLSPFRQHGLASHLLAAVIRKAVEEYGIIAVQAHVWEANDEAIQWYKRRGFAIVGREEGYYRRLAPKTAAWIVSQNVEPLD